MFCSRRSFLGASVGSAVLGRAQPTGLAPLGLALYTVRDQLEKKPLETLRLAAEIGYKDVEIMRRQIEPLAPHLRATGLRAVSVHFETPLITGNYAAWKATQMPPFDERLTFDDVVEVSRRSGLKYVVFNYLAPQERGELDFYRGLADKLNRAAEKCRAAGLRMLYHNHNFEFQQKTGGRPFDVLRERLDPALVSFELDLFWAGMSGENPARLLRELSGRVVAVHLKDRKRGTERPKFDIASVPLDTFREVGAGELDWKELLAAARGARVEHYFVEQDHSPDPLRSIRESYTALRKLGF